jgi:hypothetical protein
MRPNPSMRVRGRMTCRSIVLAFFSTKYSSITTRMCVWARPWMNTPTKMAPVNARSEARSGRRRNRLGVLSIGVTPGTALRMHGNASPAIEARPRLATLFPERRPVKALQLHDELLSSRVHRLALAHGLPPRHYGNVWESAPAHGRRGSTSPCREPYRANCISA